MFRSQYGRSLGKAKQQELHWKVKEIDNAMYLDVIV